MDFETEMRNRMIRLEQKVDFLLQELNLTEKEAAQSTPADPTLAEVIRLLREGNAVAAIHFYSRQKEISTKEAKKVIDQYLEEMRKNG